MVVPEPFFQPRGTPFSVLHRLKALSSFGHYIDLITYHIGEDIPIKNIHIHRTINIPFIRHVDIGPSFKKILCDIFLLLKTIRFLTARKYDVLHTHEEAGFIAAVLKLFFNIPHIYDMHSSLPQQLKNFDKGNLRPLVRLFEWLEKKTLDSADGIITICEDLQNHVKDVAPHRSPVLIENVGDNSTIFEDLGAIEVQKKYRIPKQKSIILYTGTFEKYQGIELLIHSAVSLLKKDRDALYLLVGGKSHQIRKMKLLANSLGIGDKVIFTGTVHPREIKYFYGISDIIASPRIQGTNSPLKIYSYLRSGIPIVATDLYTHRQILNENVAVLVEPDPEKFANGISNLLGDEMMRERIVLQAKKLAEKKYSYRDYLEKTKSVYENIQSNYTKT